MRPRVLFVSYTAEWTGPTISLSLLIEHLRDRYRIAVLLPGEGDFARHLASEEVVVHRFPTLRRAAIPRMAYLVHRKGIDLVYGNNTSGVSRNALVAAKLVRRPFIYHVREMGRPGNWRQTGLMRWADSVIAVSRAAARSVEPYARPERLHVVHNGVPIDTPPVDAGGASSRLRRVAGLDPDAVVLLSIGDVVARKGHEQAVRALARVGSRFPEAHLAVAGRLDREPEAVRRVRRLARELDLEDRVRLLGFRDDVQDLLPGADLLVHTPVAEPHGRAVVEAMLARVPVVATAVDGVVESVAHGETGILVEPGDVSRLAEAIVELLADPARRAELGERGHARAVECFSAERTAREVGDIIDRTLARC